MLGQKLHRHIFPHCVIWLTLKHCKLLYCNTKNFDILESNAALGEKLHH